MKTFKRFLASLMVAVMVLTAVPLSGFVGLELNLDWLSFDWLDFNTKSSAAEDDVRGDVTNDGIINSSDALKVLQYVVKRIELIDEALHQADVNKDGFVNSSDAVMILRFAVGMGYSEPPETSEKAIFSLNLVEETDSKVVVAIKLESGSFAALDFGILANSAKIKKCEKITINTDIALAGGVQAQNTETGLYGCAVDPAYDTEGGVIATYTFEKVAGADISKSKLVMNITNCSSEFEIVNNIGPTIPPIWSDTCGNNLSATLYSDGCLEISGTGNMTNYSSTSLPPWYDYKDDIKSIAIYSGVTRIGNDTFVGCENLTDVYIPDTVTRIGNTAFRDCISLASIDIPASVTELGYYAFYGCTAFTSVNIPSGVTTIGNYAFGNCTGLTTVVIPDTVTTIAKNAFLKCTSLNDALYTGTNEQWSAITIEEGNEAIVDNVVITTAKGTCGENLNWYLINNEDLVISGSGSMYGYDEVYPWFDYCTSIKSVSFVGKVTSIGESAFSNCTSLTNITIPYSVTSIGYNAFGGCTGLTSITIPDSVIIIAYDAFSGCGRVVFCLEKDSYAETFAQNNGIPYLYIYDGSEEKNISVTVTSKLSFDINKETCTMTINCNGNMISFANEDVPWAEYKGYIKHVIINDGCTSISANAFENFNAIKSVTIPDSVTSIGGNAFYNCGVLENVYYTGDVVGWCAISFNSYDSNPMYYADNLYIGGELVTDLVIPDSVTIIGDYVFSNCTSLTSITIPDSVTSIGSSAFSSCTGLTSVTIPDSVTSIGYDAFYGCTGLTSVTIPDSVTSIGSSAFSGCTGLTSVTIPDSVTYIGYCVFENCTSLASVIIPDSVTSIGDYAFQGCTGLTCVTIPDSVTSIGSSAFYNCSGIIELTMPISAKIYNRSYTFGGCTNIEKITLTKGNGTTQDYGTSTSSSAANTHYQYTPWYISREKCTEVIIEDGVTGIGDYMFYGCENIGSLSLPISVQSIGNYAFKGCKNIEKLKVYNRNCTFGTETISYYTTIVGYVGSTAEAYANENGFDFELIADNDHEHIYSNNCDAECNICGYINPNAGHTYDNDCDTECNNCGFVRTPNHTDDNNDGLCDVCEKALSDILVGVTQNFKVKAGETVYIKFVPANSGVYTFYSSSSTDTYGYIFDANKNQLAYNDDGGNNSDFSITYTFKSGTVYYLGVKYYNSSNSGEIPVTIRLDQLICDHNHTHEEHQDSTCSENGYDKVICDDCGQTVSMIELPLLDHDYKTITAPPTCVDEGIVACLCRVCRDAYISEILDPLGHSELVWVTVKVPSTRNEGIMNQICPACGEVFDTKTVPAISLSADSIASIDFETNTISGFDSGSSSIGDYLSATNNGYTFTCDSEKIATGTVITLTAGEDTINEFEAIIFGDTNGDGWYDGQDAIIVDCLANGMLTKDDVSEAVYMAADCNHDGVIDQLDVDLLNEAGALLANVDQSKPAEVLLETSSEYVEYLDLIDQSPEIEDETDTPEADVETEYTTPEQDANKETNFFEMIMNFIKAIIEMILSRIPVPYK